MKKLKIKGEVIACHDCGGYGHIVYHPFSCSLPPRWKMVRVRRRWLYICGNCQKRRRNQIMAATAAVKEEYLWL